MAEFTKETHQAEHDSTKEPVTGCQWCAQEVFRRTHICHGEGASSRVLTPKPTAPPGE